VTHKLIAIVLAGGYAKRLWPLTLNEPKALLSIAGKPIINYIIDKLVTLEPPVSEIIISTNLKFLPNFEEWLKNNRYHKVRIIAEKSHSEKEKPGAIKALADIVNKIGRSEALVTAGDSLFTDRLEGFIRFFHGRNAATIAVYRAKNLEETKRGSTITMDDTNRILEFVEKPSNPTGTLVGACLYAFPIEISRRFKEYLSLGYARDEPGRFIQWLHLQEPVYGYLLKDYLWDIGTIDSYRAANEFFVRNKV